MNLTRKLYLIKSLFLFVSGADVHGGAGRRSGRHPAAADLSGDALQVLQDRTHALLQEPLWQRGFRWR